MRLINGSFLKTVVLFEDIPKSKRQRSKKQSGIPTVRCFTPAVRSWKYRGVLVSAGQDVVIHMQSSFFPDVGPLSCLEMSSLGVADCKPGLPAGARDQSWRWFRELMILGANYLVPPCPWLSSGKRKRCYNKELILVSSAGLPLEASVERIGKKGLVPGKLPLLLTETVWLLLVNMAVYLKCVNQRCIWLIVMHNLLECWRNTGIFWVCNNHWNMNA